MPQTGKLIVFCAPSGAGKTTLVRHLIQNLAELSFSVSATTRQPREGEKDGVHYYFLSLEDFKQRIAEEKFAEYEEVYPGLFYGTLKAEIQRICESGQSVILDVDVQGGIRLKEIYKNDVLAVFVKVNSVAELERRLRARNTEGEEALQMRVAKAAEEMALEKHFDVSIVNEDLAQAKREAENLVRDFIGVTVWKIANEWISAFTLVLLIPFT